MGYYWFGIKNNRRRDAARRENVFATINSGYHGETNGEKRESWSKSHAHLINREAMQQSLTSKIHLAMVFVTLVGLIITLT